MSISFRHWKIHQGLAYKAEVTDLALGAAATLNIYIKMPVTTTDVHCYYSGWTSDAATLEILEDSTVTAGTGAVIPVINRNRKSTNESIILDNGGVPAANSAMQDVTITADGTRLNYEGFSARKIEGAIAEDSGFILQSNLNYIFRLTSTAVGNQVVTLTLNWFED